MTWREWLKYKPSEDELKDMVDGTPAKKTNGLIIIGGIILLSMVYQLIDHPLYYQTILWYYLAASLLGFAFAQKTVGKYERDLQFNQIHYYNNKRENYLFYTFVIPIFYRFLIDYLHDHFHLPETLLPVPIWLYFILPILFFNQLFVYLWVAKYEKEHNVTLIFCNDYYREQQGIKS